MNEEILIQQNKMVISLLARTAIGVEQITKIVTGWKKKGSPEDYIRVYNALDGSKSIADLAKIVGVSPQGLGQVLQKWEEEGIVYKGGLGTNATYLGLLRLTVRLPQPGGAAERILRRKVRTTKGKESNKRISENRPTDPSQISEVIQNGDQPNQANSGSVRD